MHGPRPPTLRWLRASAMVGGVPAAAVALLVVSGQASPLPGLYSIALIGLSSAAVSRIWLGNLGRLGERLRGAVNDTAQPLVLDDTPLLPAVREVADGVTRLTRSLAERGALVERLRRSDATIIEALPDPLLVLSEDRTLLRANGAARALLGLPQRGGDVGGTPRGGDGGGAPRGGDYANAPRAGDTGGTPRAGDTGGAPRGGDTGGTPRAGDAFSASRVGDAAALLRHPVLADAMDKALREGVPHAADIMLPVPIPRDIAAQVIPMKTPLADGGRLMLVLADRTRERAVERMRADFVANASHELRTPLASLIGFIETLRGPAEDDAVARTRFLGIMAEQAERMRNLIDDLLGLSRIELTEHQAPTGSADIAAIARAEADAMAPILANRRATLRLDAPDSAIARPADAEQVAQVIRNLLENAIRHGREKGEVGLSVTLGPRQGVTLAVQDDGVGIAKEHIPRLTERFYRVDKGRSRNAGGTGLGLAIVKHIVIRHRGQLSIESQEGVGSKFSVWLPGDAEAGGAESKTVLVAGKRSST